jgi:hypothetical protein
VQADQRRDRQTVRPRQVRRLAEALDRRTHHRVAEPMPQVGQGLGADGPERARVSTLGIGQADGAKALPGKDMIWDRLLDEAPEISRAIYGADQSFSEMLSIYSTTLNLRELIVKWGNQPSGTELIRESEALSAWMRAVNALQPWLSNTKRNLIALKTTYQSTGHEGAASVRPNPAGPP